MEGRKNNFKINKQPAGSIPAILNSHIYMETQSTNQPPKQIRVSHDQIKSTNAFQNANEMIQMMTLKRSNHKSIEHDVNVVTNIGFDEWKHREKTTFINYEIIRELTQKQTK